MTTKTTNKLKKILAMVLTIAMVFGTMPIQAMASPYAAYVCGGEQSGLPLGDYAVDFAPGHFPDSYEAYEGQENLVFSQYVTIASAGGFAWGGAEPPVLLLDDILPPGGIPDDEDKPEDEKYDNGYENGGYQNGNGYTNGGNYGNGDDNGYPNGDNGHQNGRLSEWQRLYERRRLYQRKRIHQRRP